MALSRNYLENVRKLSRLCQHLQTDSQQEQIIAASATTLTEAQVEALTTRVQHALDHDLALPPEDGKHPTCTVLQSFQIWAVSASLSS